MFSGSELQAGGVGTMEDDGGGNVFDMEKNVKVLVGRTLKVAMCDIFIASSVFMTPRIVQKPKHTFF